MIVCGLLALGVATSVGVAWGCAYCSRDDGNGPVGTRGAWIHRRSDSVWVWNTERLGFGSWRCDLERRPLIVFVECPEGTLTLVGSPHLTSTIVCDHHMPLRVRLAETAASNFQSSRTCLCGWPVASLCSFKPLSVGARGAFNLTEDVVLPLHPIPIGFAVDTALYSCLWALVLIAPRQLRRTMQHRRGACVQCGYDLIGIPLREDGSRTCPECGIASPK